jgi:hypothetical protein
VAQDTDHWMALVNMIMNLQVPQNVGKFLNGLATCSFSRRAQLHKLVTIVKTLTYLIQYRYWEVSKQTF